MSRRDRDVARAPETHIPVEDSAQQLNLENEGGAAVTEDDAPADPSADPDSDADDASATPDAPAATTTTWLTTRADETYGGAGRFVELTAEELASAPEDLFVEPTPDQLALRVRS